MLYFNPWKVFIILGISIGSILLSLPNAFSPATLQSLPHWMQIRMPLGLDLQGGVHMLLQMNANELKEDWLEAIRGDVRQKLRGDEGGVIGYTGLNKTRDDVRVTISKPEDVDKALTRLRTLAHPISNSILGSSGMDLLVERGEGNVIIVRPSEAALTERTGNGIGSAIETLRRRLDATGTREMTIQRQGRDRILLQVPGLTDPTELKILVGKTAKLTFHLVDQSRSVADAQADRVPDGSAIYQSQNPGEPAYLLYKRSIVTGQDLTDAQAGFDGRTGEPIVSFRFNTSGAQRFGKVTQENVGHPFAIVLDDKVISAPVIREPILGGSGQISGRFTVDEANRLAVLLRSGALPASLQIVEERSVGPSLGADSIAAGKLATGVSFIGVALFMIVGYGLFGLFSILALIVNVALIIAGLSLLGATLTMPGIAGIALTIGVAVDANVLIYERMREELRAGKSAILGVEAGFSRAYATIIDSHLTGLLGGVILYWLGSGPVRGFAVTLCLGTIASLFTAITLTRLIIAFWLRKTRPVTIPL
jgi:protein-export membrane protein SecD